MSFHWPVFSRIRSESILSLYEKIRVSENPYSRIFCAVLEKINYRMCTSEAYSEPSQTSKKIVAQKIESKQESDYIKRVQYLLLELFEKISKLFIQ